MVLTTHIVVGSALAAPLVASGYPVLGVVAGLASHYALDMIPHWSYRLPSISFGKNRNEWHFKPNVVDIIFDVCKIGIDVLFGLALVFFVTAPANNYTTPLLLAGLAGILPDALQGIRLLYKKFPISQLQNFHDWWHYENGGEHDLMLTPSRFAAQLLIVLAGLFLLLVG